MLFRFYLAETRGHGINFQEARALEEERRDPVYPPQECNVGCMLYCKKDCRRMCCYRKYEQVKRCFSLALEHQIYQEDSSEKKNMESANEILRKRRPKIAQSLRTLNFPFRTTPF